MSMIEDIAIELTEDIVQLRCTTQSCIARDEDDKVNTFISIVSLFTALTSNFNIPANQLTEPDVPRRGGALLKVVRRVRGSGNGSPHPSPNGIHWRYPGGDLDKKLPEAEAL